MINKKIIIPVALSLVTITVLPSQSYAMVAVAARLGAQAAASQVATGVATAGVAAGIASVVTTPVLNTVHSISNTASTDVDIPAVSLDDDVTNNVTPLTGAEAVAATTPITADISQALSKVAEVETTIGNGIKGFILPVPLDTLRGRISVPQHSLPVPEGYYENKATAEALRGQVEGEQSTLAKALDSAKASVNQSKTDITKNVEVATQNANNAKNIVGNKANALGSMEDSIESKKAAFFASVDANKLQPVGLPTLTVNKTTFNNNLSSIKSVASSQHASNVASTTATMDSKYATATGNLSSKLSSVQAEMNRFRAAGH